MKRILTVLFLAIMTFSLTACSGGNESISGGISDTSSSLSVSETSTDSETASAAKKNESTASSPNETVSDAVDSSAVQSSGTTAEQSSTTVPTSEPTESEQSILVTFFSRTGENYGVGVIEKGNTHIIADMIAEELNADTFEIARVTPYPEEYDACTDEAQEEKSAIARPELTVTVDNFENYDIIFLGYPNWWGDMPMPVYTFLESYDFSGKTVIPFCTHAGSGLSGTVGTLRNKLSGADVLDGLAIPGTTAQNDQGTAKQAVVDWLDTLAL